MKAREKIREAIRVCGVAGESREEVLSKVKLVYKFEAPCDSTIHRWYSYFKNGCPSIEDAPRAGRPLQMVNDRLLKGIHNLIDEDPKISLSIIALLIGETKSYIQKAIETRSDLKFVEARWIPKLLDESHKSARAVYCRTTFERVREQLERVHRKSDDRGRDLAPLRSP